MFTGADPGFWQEGHQLQRPKVVEWKKCASAGSYMQPSLRVFSAQICILPQSRDSFPIIPNI